MALATQVVPVEGPYGGHDWTVVNNLAISGGEICSISGARTAVASSYTSSPKSQIFAGIAATDKEANDGRTNLGLYDMGIWLVYNGGAATIAAGDSVTLSGANTVSGAGNVKSIYTCGKALQSIATGATGEVWFSTLY